MPRKFITSKEARRDVTMMFPLVNLWESLLRRNQHFIMPEFRDKFEKALLHAKWLNKDLEKRCKDENEIDAIDTDGGVFYEVLRSLAIVEESGRLNEFITYLQQFFIEDGKPRDLRKTDSCEVSQPIPEKSNIRRV